ncbi:hypothetical protein K2173_022814 [Erythroxylum novogranatense]|uniref:RING-type domain-containing protein n=1 Tax=Erythroxylum novogranatense TaxID=1862640 RepID=A0AAV8SNP6_9ROSI|nr:hypothetical protein K2173_022814 [Erythroxylum novogranatense]
MVSDSIIPNAFVPSAPKDSGKKKRTHRSQRLKQCKLDARREQWLSQGAVKEKGSKEDANGARNSPPPPCNSERKKPLQNLETGQRGGTHEEENEKGSLHHDFDSDSPSNSPTGNSVLGGNSPGNNFTGSSSSSSSSGGWCSGNITEEEEEEEDEDGDNCLEDWEAMADALAATDESKQEIPNDGSCMESESSEGRHEPVGRLQSSSCGNFGFTRENVKQECPVPPPSPAPGKSRAWRPDDEFRPQSLPNLSKQRSFPKTERRYGQGGLPWVCSTAVNVPSSCPICYEDLDVTDTSFLPCLCGFRLCLFCHKRIIEEDGRCPGCRKPYKHDPVEAEASARGGSLTFRLARSCSMITRS